jgi:hypothetical protein
MALIYHYGTMSKVALLVMVPVTLANICQNFKYWPDKTLLGIEPERERESMNGKEISNITLTSDGCSLLLGEPAL